MKKLLWALLLCVMPIHAEEIAWTRNSNGGLIVLTNDTCWSRGKSYPDIHQMYTVAGTGQTISGCYALENNYVRVIYEDGTEYRYPVGAFTVKSKPSRNSI
jgi:hypothetical protein